MKGRREQLMSVTRAIINLLEYRDTTLREYRYGNNRANNMGVALEQYIIDLFAGTNGEQNMTVRNRKIEETFSYIGNQNNPPDAMLWGAEALEVKKLSSTTNEIALNSSYPKDALYADSSRIIAACREAEDWDEKDILYAVGCTKGANITRLFFVYGDLYAASRDTYRRVFDGVQRGIRGIPDFEFAESKELGRVPDVDPLGITYMRIRGMWHIKTPWHVYQDIYSPDAAADFNFACLIADEKWDSQEDKDALLELASQNEELSIDDVEVRNPNNTARFIGCKLITIKR